MREFLTFCNTMNMLFPCFLSFTFAFQFYKQSDMKRGREKRQHFWCDIKDGTNQIENQVKKNWENMSQKKTEWAKNNGRKMRTPMHKKRTKWNSVCIFMILVALELNCLLCECGNIMRKKWHWQWQRT